MSDVGDLEAALAIRCSRGEHEALYAPPQIGGELPELVIVRAESKYHGSLHCLICRYCRAVYFPKRARTEKP